MEKLKKFNRYAIPGSFGMPSVNQLCVFQTNNDIFFVGFIAHQQSTSIVLYPSVNEMPFDMIKNYQAIINEDHSPIFIGPVMQKEIVN
jgi:hypothetical protein